MKKLYEETDVQAIADAIRAKTGKSDVMKVSEMSGEIDGIELGWTADDLARHGISGAITISTQIVDRFAFYLYTEITSVKTTATCEQLKTSAFRSCQGIQKVDLTAVQGIGAECFIWAYPLTQLIIRTATVCVLSNNSAFTDTPIASGAGYIYVPSSLIDSYKTATNWTTYASQFRSLEDYTVDGTTTGELDESKI